MPSQCPHPDQTLVVRHDHILANRQNQQRCGRLVKSQRPPPKRFVSIPAGIRDSWDGGNTEACTIQSRNWTQSRLLDTSHVAQIPPWVTSIPSPAPIWLIYTPTARTGNPAPGGTSQTDSMRCVVSSPASSMAISPTPLGGIAHQHTTHPYPRSPCVHYESTANTIYSNESETEAVAIATVSGAWTSISGLQQVEHHSIWSLSHDASCICDGQTPRAPHVELMAIYECIRLGVIKSCNAIGCESISWSFTEVDNCDLLQHCNVANNILSIAFEACKKAILNQVYWSIVPRWIVHAQTDPRFVYKLIMINPILFDQQGVT